MFDLKKTLDSRLAALKNKTIKNPNNDTIELNNISKEYITQSLIDAGILTKDGKSFKKFNID